MSTRPLFVFCFSAGVDKDARKDKRKGTSLVVSSFLHWGMRMSRWSTIPVFLAFVGVVVCCCVLVQYSPFLFSSLFMLNLRPNTCVYAPLTNNHNTTEKPEKVDKVVCNRNRVLDHERQEEGRPWFDIWHMTWGPCPRATQSEYVSLFPC